MWFERYVIIVTSLHRDYLPSSWSMHYPSHIDIGVYIGTIGIFFVFFLLFASYFPVLALNEVKTILKSSGEYYKNLPDGHKEETAVTKEEKPTSSKKESKEDKKTDDKGKKSVKSAAKKPASPRKKKDDNNDSK